MPDMSDQVLHTGRFLRLCSRGGWEFAQRTASGGVVGILALTEAGALLVVEQYRRPVDRRVLELPAGLAGDAGDAPVETLADAARRELLEETGYFAERMELLTVGPSSAGMTDECVALFRTVEVSRRTSGGGIDGEAIVVHEVPLDALPAWLSAQQASGKLVDFKLWAAPVLARLPAWQGASEAR